MNEFKGTPAPWEFFQVEDGVGVVSLHADVAHCLGFDSNRSPAEECANAKLIAASPELFKAVNDFLNHFEGDIPLWLFEEAEAAVAKALGK